MSSANNSQTEKLISLIKNMDIEAFLLEFSIFMCGNNKNNMIKAAALLCHIILENTEEYNTLIQTVSIDDLNDENIEIVLNVADSIYRFDFNTLQSICSKAPKELSPLIMNIIENQKKVYEQVSVNNKATPGIVSVQADDALETLKNCMFVIKNFNGN